jgi:hypothetical protein
MKLEHTAVAAFLLLGGGQLLAQTCANPDRLNAAQIQSALGNKWFCAQKTPGDPKDMWREYIPIAASGTFQECHSGLTTGPDPKDTNKGTYAITSPGQIAFTYPPSGGTYTYEVCPAGTDRYVFRDTSGSGTAGFYVYISSCPPGGISPAQKTSCP